MSVISLTTCSQLLVSLMKTVTVKRPSRNQELFSMLEKNLLRLFKKEVIHLFHEIFKYSITLCGRSRLSIEPQ